MRGKDEIVGLSDGASWIKHLFETLGVEHIIDVYHSSSYLDTVMKALGRDEQQRATTRAEWLRGEISAADWLREQLHESSLWFSEDEEVQTALRYLRERQHHMDYPSYKTRGLPIGSGQIEGVNKSIIGFRMKQSGMQWSRPGAGRMASLRARRCFKHPLVSYDTIRHHAFSSPTS